MNPTLAITPDRITLRLSDTIVVTVVVEGTAPLRVEVPKDLLTGASADIWRVDPAGPAGTAALPDDRARWTQQYQCSPFQPGAGLPLEFAPFRVKAGPAVEAVALSDKPLSFTVRTDLLGAKAEDARPATGVEELPPPPTSPVGLPAVWAIAVGGVLVAAAAVFATVRRRNRVPEVPPTAEALAALDTASDPPPERVAAVVRRFLRRRFGLPTDPVTTRELLALVRERTDWPAERVADLDAILSACDVAKFTDRLPGAEAATATRDAARAWVAAVG